MDNNGFVKVAPTLIVGFGGTGSLGVQYAKRKIKKQLKQLAGNRDVPQKLPFIEYVVLDTTPQEEFIEDLPGDEYINLGHVNVPRLIKYVDSDPSLRQAMDWFPRHINPGQIDAGARGVRHIGRLCFFNRLPQIDTTIRTKVQQITNYAAIDRSLKEECNYLTMESGSTIDVHLISSLCGGTGSACLLDAAYLIKHIVNEVLQQGTNSTAHLLTTEAFVGDNGVNASSREYIKYNFAISLAEIERFMNFEVVLSEPDSAGGNGSWHVKYLDGREITSMEKPFSLAYLLGYKEGETVSKKNLCEIVGDAIALCTVNRENHQLKGLLDNAKAHVVTQKNSLGKVKAYSSYNTRTLSAEFDEQTFQASSYLACETILEALLSKDSQIESAELLAEFRKGMGRQSRDDRYTFEVSGPQLSSTCDQIEAGLAINKDAFNDIERKILKLSGKRKWPWSRDGLLQDQVYRAKEEYERIRQNYRDDAKRIALDLRAWTDDVRVKTPDRVYRLLLDGQKFPAVTGTLNLLWGELNEVVQDVRGRQERLKLSDDKGEAWMKDAIQTKQFSEQAVSHMKSEVLIPLFAGVEKIIEELSNYVDVLAKTCANAEACLKLTKDFVKEERAKSYSFTESSVWTREKVNVKIKEPEVIQKLTKRFITSMEHQFLCADHNADKEISFLWYLDPHEPNVRGSVLKLLREVAHGIVKEEMQIREIDFNQPDGQNSQTAIHNEELNRLVEMTAPVWQVQRAGEDIAQIAITNCPKETRIGRLIASLGKNITFAESTADPKNILIFRSEHGVTADRLLTLGECVAAMKRRLTVEDKVSIKELSLDPAWDIEEPGTSVTEEEMLALFSLGTMFGLIREDFGKYSFSGADGEDIVLAHSSDKAHIERSAVFARFLMLRSSRNHQIMSLIEAIEQQWEAERNQGLESFLQRVKTHLAKRRDSGNATASRNGAEDKSQWDREIAALQTEVVAPMESFINSRRSEAGPAARGHAAG